jgi:glycosyltransferase involved in cell wall biosynthesis
MLESLNFSKNPRIAFICFSASLGGLELTTVRLARDLKTRMADCLLVVPPGTLLADQAVKNGLEVEFLDPKLKYGDVLAAVRLARILCSRRIEIAILMQSKDINVAAAAALAYPRLKLVYYQQMQSGVNKRDLLHTWMYSKLSLWISLTNRMKQEVVEHTRVHEGMINVVPLGRDTRLFDPNIYDQSEARKRYGFPQGRPIVGMVGRLDPQKGQEEFLRSMPLVLKRQRDVYFVIAGDETRGEEGYKKHLLDLSDELGVKDHVRFLPFTENVPEFMAAIDLFILPSYGETYGLVLIEAMAMGKPVVATNAGGVPEIVEDGRDGLLVPPRDEKALADAVVRLLGDASLRRSFSEQARKDAVERFDSARCIDQLVRSLDAL